MVHQPSYWLARNSRSLTILSRTYWNQRRRIRDRSDKNGQALWVLNECNDCSSGAEGLLDELWSSNHDHWSFQAWFWCCCCLHVNSKANALQVMGEKTVDGHAVCGGQAPGHRGWAQCWQRVGCNFVIFMDILYFDFFCILCCDSWGNERMYSKILLGDSNKTTNFAPSALSGSWSTYSLWSLHI